MPDFKGSHNLRPGSNSRRTRVKNHVQDNLNGTFRFSHNLVFDAADPRTWPDQFAIRVPIESIFIETSRTTTAGSSRTSGRSASASR